jgi:putative redox protein
MKASCQWQQKMLFNLEMGNHRVSIDAPEPFGANSAPSPKQLTLGSLCGCTAMDVISLLRKHKQDVHSLRIEADAPKTSGQPSVFASVHLRYYLDGTLDEDKVLEAIHLSQSKYCGVSAMIDKIAPISYDVFVNGKSVGSGKAEFSL